MQKAGVKFFLSKFVMVHGKAASVKTMVSLDRKYWKFHLVNYNKYTA